MQNNRTLSVAIRTEDSKQLNSVLLKFDQIKIENLINIYQLHLCIVVDYLILLRIFVTSCTVENIANITTAVVVKSDWTLFYFSVIQGTPRTRGVPSHTSMEYLPV